MFSSKGFLGPIGDDLPSLIPLVFSLVLFFSTFTFAFNSFENRNSYFNDTVEILNISSNLKQGSYISDYSHFIQSCRGFSVSRVYFKVALVSLEDYFNGTGPFAGNQRIDVEKLDDLAYCVSNPRNTSGLACKNITASDKNSFICSNSSKEPTNSSSNLLLRVYPIVLETHEFESNVGFAAKPMLLVVVTWRS